MSSSEAEDSPIHRKLNLYNSHNQFSTTKPNQITIYQHQTAAAGLSDTPSSDNGSDNTISDSEVVLARDNTLLVHNGEFFFQTFIQYLKIPTWYINHRQ